MTTSGISSVMARISNIEARFAGPTQQQPVVVELGAEFDAFGATYEQALTQAQATATDTRSMTPAMAANPYATSTLAFGRIAGGTMLGSTYGADAFGSERVTAAIDGVATSAGTRPIGGYGSMPVPGELAGYGNGKLPVGQLAPIAQGGHRLYAPAAQSWDNLVRDAAAAGFELKITDSYRSYDQQVDLANRKGLYSQGGLAATPGTSNHGWGLAVDADVTDPALLGWLRQNGPRYGWVEAVPREPWHWEFRPGQV